MDTTFHPIRRSAIHHVMEHHNAQFTEQNGWEIITSFSGVDSELQAIRSSVGINDNSWCGKIEVKGKGAAAFIAGLGLKGARAYRIHDDHSMVITEPNQTDATARQLTEEVGRKDGIHVIPNSSFYASFVIVGPMAERVLRKIAAFNFSILGQNGHAACSVSHTPTLVVRVGDRFDLHFPREFAEFLWETILDAGAEFHIRPFGTEALARL